jgi:hypothetical protein
MIAVVTAAAEAVVVFAGWPTQMRFENRPSKAG